MCLIKIIVIIIVRPNTCHNICLAKIVIKTFITHKMIKKNTNLFFIFKTAKLPNRKNNKWNVVKITKFRSGQHYSCIKLH